ncbi:MAG: hypothetical protein NUV92_09700 [Ignavibacteria bacterium]|nr:hypothetical protein [Ignavibacteria bacterium]MDH7528200.1 hypothetical protein [Ignavibacteria bacterium]
MKYDPSKHHRRSIRLKGYDYSQAGAYFVTICTKNRECLFGTIENGKMVLNDAGKMIEKWYFKLPNKFPDIRCDEYIIMPNHIHFIIINVGADNHVCPDNSNHRVNHDNSDQRVKPNNSDQHVNPDKIDGNIHSGEHIDRGEHKGSPLPRVVQWFKTMTTNEYIFNVKNMGWKPFNGKLWQRNYYEHIIRNEEELNRIRKYIITNPLKWELDKNYSGK